MMPALLLRCKNKGFAEKAERTPPCPSDLISSEHFGSCVHVSCEACRSMCAQAIQRGFLCTVGECLCAATALGTAGRCSSQTVGRGCH